MKLKFYKDIEFQIIVVSAEKEMLCGLRKGVGAVLRSTGRAVDLLGTFFMVNPEFDRCK